MAGLTDVGFQKATVEEILAELQASVLSTVDAGLDLSPEGPLGQLLGIVAEREANLWDLLEVLFTALVNPNDAASYLLDSICAITGTRRERSDYSYVDATCNLNAGTALVAGTSKAYPVGQATNTWTPVANFTAPTTGNHVVRFRSTEKGPFAANAGTLTVIATPTVGWNSVTNAVGATVGRYREQDSELKVRRLQELAGAGGSTPDGLYVDLLQVPGVISARVFENTSDVTDSDGLPPHSFEALIWDGLTPLASNAVVGQVVWDNKPSGIAMYGGVSVSVVDSQGVARTAKFSRPTQVPIYVDAFVSVDPLVYPVNGPDLVKAAVVAEGSKAAPGRNVTALALRAAILAVPGVLDVPTFELGTTASPTGTANVVISSRQIATFDVARVTVTSV